MVLLIVKNLLQGDLLTKGYRKTETQHCKEKTKASTALFWKDLVGVLVLAQIFGEGLVSSLIQDINLSVRIITNTTQRCYGSS